MRFLQHVVSAILVVCIWFAHGCNTHATAQSAVVLVLVDRLTVDDLRTPEAEPLRHLATYGGVGLANVRTAGNPANGSGYLSIGAGERAVGGELSGVALDWDESYGGHRPRDLFRSLTGEAAGGDVIHIGFAELLQLAGAGGRVVSPGRLGERVREAGLSVSVYGNSDTLHERRRFGVLAAMDASGQVAKGRVGSDVLLVDPEWPFGMRTNYEAMRSLTLRHTDEFGLVVIELGDLARLEEYESLMTPNQMQIHRTTALARIGQFVYDLLQEAHQASIPTSIIIVAPSPSVAAFRQGFLIAPVVVGSFAPGQHQGGGTGLVTSATTRRPGIVANYDITSTVLQMFGLPLGEIGGRPLRTVPEDDPWHRLAGLYDKITRVNAQRLPIIQPYFFVQLGVILLSTIAVGSFRIARLHSRTWVRLALIIHLGLVAFPLALLVLPLLPSSHNVTIVWLQVLAIIGILVWIASRFYRLGPPMPFVVLCGATVLALTIDTLTGARLMQSSHLGYDAIGGSRYYGIGNEYMGVLLGTASIMAGGLLDWEPVQKRRGIYLWLVSGLFIVLTACLASPLHGANVGGTISAVIGLGAVIILFVKTRLDIRDLVVLGVILAIVLGVVSWYDVTVAGQETSHLGSAVQKVGSQGGDPLWSVVERKIAMNIRLIRLTVWSRAFFVSLLTALFFGFYPPRLVATLMRRYPNLGLAIRGSLVAAVVVLVANDSGIVGAATLMIPVISTLLYLMMHLADKTIRSDPNTPRQVSIDVNEK